MPEGRQQHDRGGDGRGDSRDPSQAYVAFRGREATIEPMLRKRGLLVEA